MSLSRYIDDFTFIFKFLQTAEFYLHIKITNLSRLEIQILTLRYLKQQKYLFNTVKYLSTSVILNQVTV